MVVGDNDRHAQAVGIGDRLPRLNAAVRRNDKRCALLIGPVNRPRFNVVAVVLAVRHAVNQLRAQRRQRPHVDRRAGDPVHIIIAMHKDRLACSPARL